MTIALTTNNKNIQKEQKKARLHEVEELMLLSKKVLNFELRIKNDKKPFEYNVIKDDRLNMLAKKTNNIYSLLHFQRLIVKKNTWHTRQLFLYLHFIYNQSFEIQTIYKFMKYFSCFDLLKISNYLTKQKVSSSKREFFNTLLYLTEGKESFVSDHDLKLATNLHVRTIYRHLEYFKTLELITYRDLNSTEIHQKRKIQITLPFQLSSADLFKDKTNNALVFNEMSTEELSSFLKNLINSGYYGFRFCFSKEYMVELCVKYSLPITLEHLDEALKHLIRKYEVFNSCINRSFVEESYFLPKAERYEPRYLTPINSINHDSHESHKIFLEQVDKKFNDSFSHIKKLVKAQSDELVVLHGEKMTSYQGKTVLSNIRMLDKTTVADYEVIDDELILESKSPLCFFKALIAKTSLGYSIQPLEAS